MDKVYRKEWRIPSTLEYNRLREAVGWGRMPVDVVSFSLKNSLASVCVSQGSQVLGCGRIIGDGGLAFYIQDVMVHPEHQRKGIGNSIMLALVGYLKENVPHHAHIGLMDSPGADRFLAKYRYISRPLEGQGPSGLGFFELHQG
jgi:ribosomal protein S18 acetylase RimI-like enzyme